MRLSPYKHTKSEDAATAFLLILLTLVGPWLWSKTAASLLPIGRRAFDASLVPAAFLHPASYEFSGILLVFLGTILSLALLAMGGAAWFFRPSASSAYTKHLSTESYITGLSLLAWGLVLLLAIPLWRELIVPATTDLGMHVARLLRILFALAAGIALLRMLARPR